ncbi:sensor histidine kinase [Flavobacterium cerinum]|uniref:Histidine kinase n=1 Tax=Flavobacterium cerinum TaxID=2502784 RepID=A0ABY5IQN7_9FLAO|nr:histidine kinase [Flavobacterium cerinum]UUC45165.1 histidine kinase [Flavobacterium cerinum]
MKHDFGEPKEKKIIACLLDDKYRLLRHGFLLVTVLLMLFYSNWFQNYNGLYKYERLICVFIMLVSLSYINMYILVPGFFFKEHYLLYLILLILVITIGVNILGMVMDYFKFSDAKEVVDRGGGYEGVFILVPIILTTTTIKLFQRWTKDNRKIAELNHLTLVMELNELRNQINPHFLFNMLNGIKALVRSNPEKATFAIMKLSEFLRYQLYENNEEKTILKAEINFLSNFLDLEKLRRDKLSVRIDSTIPIQTLNTTFLPPNLFTTFVENAVKHSVNLAGAESTVAIGIEIVGDRLHFVCTNSKDPHYIPGGPKNNGLGLPNIKRRLELLYAENYTLEINSNDMEYVVNLTIPI